MHCVRIGEPLSLSPIQTEWTCPSLDKKSSNLLAIALRADSWIVDGDDLCISIFPKTLFPSQRKNLIYSFPHQLATHVLGAADYQNVH